MVLHRHTLERFADSCQGTDKSMLCSTAHAARSRSIEPIQSYHCHAACARRAAAAADSAPSVQAAGRSTSATSSLARACARLHAARRRGSVATVTHPTVTFPRSTVTSRSTITVRSSSTRSQPPSVPPCSSETVRGSPGASSPLSRPRTPFADIRGSHTAEPSGSRSRHRPAALPDPSTTPETASHSF